MPKMSGRLLDERAGAWSFWIMFVGFNLGFLPMHVAGLLGMPRRIFTYPEGMGWDWVNLLTSIGSFLFAAGVLVSLGNVVASLRRGRLAGPDPWRADTLEWSMPSPPPVYAFARLPVVATRNPLWDDFDEFADPADERRLDHGRFTLSTSALDAAPRAVAKMPEDTLAPFLLAVLLTALFTALLLKSLVAAGAIAVACLAMAAYWLWPEAEKHA
jgi:heme/copper-type cytochrome/quinol oxidase subunit 1